MSRHAHEQAPVDPTDGDTLNFPSEPLAFSWNPLSGAKSYVLEIDNADDFIGAQPNQCM